jgi:NAD-dependent deacetylase
MTDAEDLAPLIDCLVESRRISVLTGAGMSADSGVPTFRGNGASLWQRFDPARLATADAWRQDPALVWGWYAWRMAVVRAAQPNAGHLALAGLARSRPLTVVTQNVDDLHERAGSQGVLHLHGSLFACRCIDCGRPCNVDIPADAAHSPRLRRAPARCVDCGAEVRPGVVWFGEPLPPAVWDAAVQAVAACDLLLVIGTSGVVQPAASLAGLARRAGARVVEINPEPSALRDDVHLAVRATAATALGSAVAALARHAVGEDLPPPDRA